ncbi:hypothetical protein DR950_00245 [Kitasatospora xanthocidica]|uniref:Uncharacterized protein n=1 Tax=Kitasatospora xanthocidica TaxID=83382 RepID=A0A372ZMG2_9ACTN|nr:hypothetical protein [Kitasatospora xanthocidica]RGD56425.1 hypothetical protein DR950_00245 [Kitasatospora xanthocidica]
MSDHSGRPARRPLWQPFSEPATDQAVPQAGRPRLLAIERAPFLEPADGSGIPARQPAPARRRLGHGALPDTAADDRT